MASIRVKEMIRNLFPSFYQYYRLFYNVFFLAFWGFISWWYVARHEYEYLFTPHFFIKSIGYLVVSAALTLIIFSLYSYGMSEFTGIDAFMKHAGKIQKPVVRLRTDGIHSIVRHPVYTGILIALVGLLLILPTKMTLYGIMLSLIYLEIGIWLEERKLLLEFGDQYARYKKQVKKIIPFIY
jgi:protein-S-isoprenylcysteine O-methyltransferase Ste14